jgi:hypothetical protein
MKSMRRPLVFLGLAAVMTAALLPMSAQADTTPAPVISWVSPSPAPGTVLNVTAEETVTISVAASDTTPTAIVHITATGPDGATLATQDGNPATATVTWTPTADQVGQATITFNATDNATPPTTAPPLAVTVEVAAPPPPPITTLTDDKTSHWAYVLLPTVARAAPDASAKIVTRIGTRTGDGTSNILLLLAQQTLTDGTWVKVRLAILPNNSTGWVQRITLSTYKTVHTHLYINRGLRLLQLQRNGKRIFQTSVGVGKPYWPTPKGQFYVRDKLLGFSDPFYGPIAFGTSGRSAVLTDWPGGGFVGVHGTNMPELIPGPISHGCVRLKNPDILRLAGLMPVGTPVTIS